MPGNALCLGISSELSGRLSSAKGELFTSVILARQGVHGAFVWARIPRCDTQFGVRDREPIWV